MSRQQQREQVVCICGGFGYPRGAGSPARITVVGKAVQSAGMEFQLLHNGPSPTPLNTESSGVYEGIPFRYTTTITRPKNPLLRGLVYLMALVNITLALFRLRGERERTVIWLYYIGGLANLYLNHLCHLLGLHTVQELCEWWPGEPTCSPFVRWQHRRQLFVNLSGVLVISKLVEERTIDICRRANPGVRVHRLPSIVDTHRFLPKKTNPEHSNYFVWCGGEGWQRDVRYIIAAAAMVRKKGHDARVRILGNFGPTSRQSLLQYAAELGLPPGALDMTGYVDDRALENYYQTSAALLLPLWDDDRSRTRMPNKLGEYLASGRPVLTCDVGDLNDFLHHGVDACLARPGELEHFADQMEWILSNPDAASAMGEAGQQAALSYLDYRARAEALSGFFRDCLRRIPVRANAIQRISGRVRWAACGLLAEGMMLAGFVRRALLRLANRDVITSLYFHDPKGDLFERCVVWLKEQGYHFVSADDVIRILRGQQAFPRKAVWISLDDGHRGLRQTVLPVVQKHQVPVTLFIPSGIVGGDGLYPWHHDGRYPVVPRKVDDWSGEVAAPREALTREELQAAIEIPQVTIGAHTVNHMALGYCTDTQVTYEIDESRRALEEFTSRPVDTFSYPGGYVDLRADGYLRGRNFALAATTEPAFITPQSDLHLVPRVCVPDDITFAEAICNMTGVWRGVADRIKSALRIPSTIPDLPRFNEHRAEVRR